MDAKWGSRSQLCQSAVFISTVHIMDVEMKTGLRKRLIRTTKNNTPNMTYKYLKLKKYQKGMNINGMS